MSIKSQKKRLGAGAGGSGGSSSSGGPQVALQPNRDCHYITAPPSPAELAAWKDTISSKEAWSMALPLLQTYYHQHGFGITSRNATLRCGRILCLCGTTQYSGGRVDGHACMRGPGRGKRGQP